MNKFHSGRKCTLISRRITAIILIVIGASLLVSYTMQNNLLSETTYKKTSHFNTIKSASHSLKYKTSKNIIHESSNHSRSISISFNYSQKNSIKGPIPLLTIPTTSGGILLLIENNSLNLCMPRATIIPLTATSKTFKTFFNISISHDQTIDVRMDGKQVYGWIWNKPIFALSSNQILVNTIAGLKVENLSITSQESAPLKASKKNMIRAIQVIGFVLCTLGVAVLFDSFFSRRIKKTKLVNTKLLTTFLLTLGIGISTNLIINKLNIRQISDGYSPVHSWLFSEFPRFSDFFQPFEFIKEHNPYGQVNQSNYPPFVFLLLAPFTLLKPFQALFIYVSMTFGFITWWYKHQMMLGKNLFHNMLGFLIIILSLPVTYAIDRGNLIVIPFILFTIFYLTNEGNGNDLKIGLITLAAAVKIYPIFYLLENERWGKKKLLRIFSVISISCFLPLFFFSGGLFQNVREFLHNIFPSSSIPAIGNASLYGFIQSIYVIAKHQPIENSPLSAGVSSYLVLLLTLIVFYVFLKNNKHHIWEGFIIITLLYILLMPFSFFYELIFLLPMIPHFFVESKINKSSLIIAAAYAVVLSPKSFYMFAPGIGTAELLQAPSEVLLLLLLVKSVTAGENFSRTS